MLSSLIRLQFYLCYVIFPWGNAVLELDCHADHNKGRPTHVPCASLKTHSLLDPKSYIADLKARPLSGIPNCAW